jgi:LmbE family N-acetylglucosaminyl deacetylase
VVITGNKKRNQESLSAANFLPNISVEFFDENEFEDFVKPEIADRITGFIHDFKPNILITHHPDDVHIDHRRTSELTLMSLLKLNRQNYPEKVFYSNTYFQYDLYSKCLSPDKFVDISDHFSLKEKMIKCHESQNPQKYIEMVNAMDTSNGIKSGVKKAEAFCTVTTHISNRAQNDLL